MKRKTVLFFLLALLISCVNLLDGNIWSEGNYAVYSDPINPACKIIGYNLGNGGYIGREGSCVKELGYNEQFIIWKCSRGICEEETSFWILDKTKDSKYKNGDEISEGPMRWEKFKKRKQDLGIIDLSVTVFF